VEEFFFIFDRSGVLWSIFHENLRRRCTGWCAKDALFQETQGAGDAVYGHLLRSGQGFFANASSHFLRLAMNAARWR
jgi:hypothetical protein